MSNLNVIGNVYVINLQRHKIRRRRIFHQFVKLKTNFEFVDALDYSNYTLSPDTLSSSFYDPNGWLSYGIICCHLSHRKAWEKFIESGNEYGIFLEDDVKYTNIIHNFNFDALKNQLNLINNLGVCWLGKYSKEIKVGDYISEIKNSLLYKNIKFDQDQFAAHAYILSRKAAQWYLKTSSPIKYAVDFALEMNPFNNVTLKKSLFIQRHIELEKHHEQINTNPRYKWLEEFLHWTVKDVDYDEGIKGNNYGMMLNTNIPIKNISDFRLGHCDKSIMVKKFDIF